MPQSLSSVLVHLVFSTKRRQPVLTADIETELHAYLGGVFQALDCPALAIGGSVDHVHCLFRLARTRTLAEVVEEVKKRSSKWLKSKGAVFRGFQWQVGYGAFSLGESGVGAMRAYIAGQKEHHRRISFQEEVRAFLAKYKVAYDERYVWD
jgi:REP element-mobilizing transposase RayT